MEIQTVIDATQRAAQRAAENVANTRTVKRWPKPDDPASELACTRAFLAWTNDNADTLQRVTLAQLQSIVSVWKDEYFTTLIRAAPSRMVHADLRTIGDRPTADGGGGRTVKCWECRDCSFVVPLRWFAGEPRVCLQCGSHSAVVFDQDEPDPAVIREAFYGLLMDKLRERPAGADTLASLFDLDAEAVGAALLRLQNDGRVVNHGGVFAPAARSAEAATHA